MESKSAEGSICSLVLQRDIHSPWETKMKKSDNVDKLPIDRVQDVLDHRAKKNRAKVAVPASQLVSLRVDSDVLEYFRSTGENWQSRMNAVLRKAAKL